MYNRKIHDFTVRSNQRETATILINTNMSGHITSNDAIHPLQLYLQINKCVAYTTSIQIYSRSSHRKQQSHDKRLEALRTSHAQGT